MTNTPDVRNLLNFIIRFSTWFIFMFYVLLSCILLFSYNRMQQSIYLTSAGYVTSGVYSAWANVTGYFALRRINADLQERNALLETEVLNLRAQLAEAHTLIADTAAAAILPGRFDYEAAAVINNSTRHPRNFFTITKGAADGLIPGMGVVDHNGVVGIVNMVGEHTARVVSLLNETQHFSVRLKDSPYVGSLSWRGGDPDVAYMEEVPRHVKFRTGDTVVTSGYSTTFPEGIPVGTVLNRVRSRDDNFFTLKIRLASDFKTLGTVRVIKDELKAELDSLNSHDEASGR
ncbi:MAG: rod shape-determining protein MreC [Muribaculaceae bacterium]|nr:rod shape-determining protein MreC [Muribaculaceae bacterium]